MRDSRLVDLNFREIVNYGGQPPVEVRFKTSPTCHGYCVSCEQFGVLGLGQAGGKLDLMSHGCDSKDFETILRRMPTSEKRPITEPVLFLLNEPANSYELCEPIPYLGFVKQPPVKHYYWAPGCQSWPVQVTELKNDFYGSYFAYLMRRHQLQNVYITNRVKCQWHPQNKKKSNRLIVEHCVNRFLKREVEIFAPKLAFCFGKKAQGTFQNLVQPDIPHCQMVRLYHPSYIATKGAVVAKALQLQYLPSTERQAKAQEHLMKQDDERIERCLQALRDDDHQSNAQ